MARKKGWSKNPTILVDVSVDDHTKIMRAIGVRLGTKLIFKTPVDTGRARNGWMASVNTPAPTSRNIPGPTGAHAMSALRAKFSKAGVPDFAVLYVSNNIPYIGELNNGHSKQAPKHFVEMSVQEIKNVF